MLIRFDHIYVRYLFEEGVDLDQNYIVEVTEEIAQLLMVCHTDRDVILSNKYNSISVGFEYNEFCMAVVLMFTYAKVGISKVYQVDIAMMARRTQHRTRWASWLKAE